jgi:hypothetical protein
MHRLLSNTEILAGCTQAKVGEISEWTSIVNSAEENRANFVKVQMGSRFLALFTVCTL